MDQALPSALASVNACISAVTDGNEQPWGLVADPQMPAQKNQTSQGAEKMVRCKEAEKSRPRGVFS
jgi:hypothetical protein